MEGSIRLSATERKTLLTGCQRGPSLKIARRCQVILASSKTPLASLVR